MVDLIYRNTMLRYKRYSDILFAVAILSVTSEYVFCLLFIIFKMYSVNSLFILIAVPIIGQIAEYKSEEFEKESNKYKTLLDVRK